MLDRYTTSPPDATAFTCDLGDHFVIEYVFLRAVLLPTGETLFHSFAGVAAGLEESVGIALDPYK
jgi:hypothetical protein